MSPFMLFSHRKMMKHFVLDGRPLDLIKKLQPALAV